ncbi:hypothetical protein ACIBCC_29670 [Streptomyces griseus]|uniref:hypothetical protein n=1 Tax=Streptomyces griseus TaxID=1911 RepID=UPI0037A96ADF
MVQEAADGTQQTEQDQVPIDLVGLIGACARLAQAQTTATLRPHVDDPKARLVEAFETTGSPGVVVKVGDQIVARYTVDLTKGKFVVDPDNEKALNAYADAHSGMEVIIRRNPTWEKGLLNAARRVKDSDDIIDSRTGEVVPGLKFVPGGRPTGNVTFTWEGKETGQEILRRAWASGELRHLLQDVPELGAGPEQPAENA